MKVAVETSALYTSRAGVARYVSGLLHGLRALQPEGVEITELGWPVENFDYGQPARALKTLAREWGWAKLVAPRTVCAADVLHHTALPMIPYVRPARHVVTLHDVGLLHDPARFRRWQRWSGCRRLARVQDADRIICVTRAVADEAVGLLGISATRIEVVHEAAWLPGETTAAAPPPGLPSDYFLFVGSLEPNKNLALLREIYLEVSGPLPPLVVVGARWAGVAHEGPAPAGWHFPGHVARASLPALYRGARALLFPSRYEGFGLPVLEAMSVGCPVLCGPVPALQEIGADAVAQAELTPESYGAGMRRLLGDEDWRRGLKAAGLARAAQFSWEKCARETLAVYRAVSPA